MTKKIMPKLPSMPSSKRGNRDMTACDCGCGLVGPGRFRPGHDSTLKAWVIRVERGVIKLSEIEHEGLKAAIEREMANRTAATLPIRKTEVA